MDLPGGALTNRRPPSPNHALSHSNRTLANMLADALPTRDPSLSCPTRVASVTHAGLAKGYSSTPIVSLVAIPVTNRFPSASTENKGCFIRFLYPIQ